jgi:hypothetical protein
MEELTDWHKNVANRNEKMDAIEQNRKAVLPYPEMEVVPKKVPPKIKAQVRKAPKEAVPKKKFTPGTFVPIDIVGALNELEHYMKETTGLTYFERIQKEAPKVLSMSERSSGDVVAKTVKILKGIKRPMMYVPQVSDREWIRFNLMETLYHLQHEIVLSEFKYAGCIADVFSIVNGRGVEFEIKMSQTDLIKDFDKRMSIGGGTPLKHNILASGKSMVSRFYFVVPEGLLLDIECPEYAGLITFDITMANGWLFRVVKPAPMLHKNFISGSTWATIAKRLSLKLKNISMRYDRNNFIAVRRLGLWQPRP